MFRLIALTKAFNGRFVTLKREGQVPRPIPRPRDRRRWSRWCTALREDDYVVNYYRGFAEWITRGVDLGALAEMLGKAPDCAPVRAAR